MGGHLLIPIFYTDIGNLLVLVMQSFAVESHEHCSQQVTPSHQLLSFSSLNCTACTLAWAKDSAFLQSILHSMKLWWLSTSKANPTKGKFITLIKAQIELTVMVESPNTSQSTLLKKQELRQKKKNWDRKLNNRQDSKANFWIYCRQLNANAKFKMADYSKTILT